MKALVIRPGDDLASLAARLGFDADEVWNNEQNREIRELRGDPEVLAPGDVIYVPEPVEERCHLAAQTTNRYQATVEMVHLDLVLGAGGSEGFANEPYEVRGLAQPITGSSDGEGRVSIEVPAHVRELVLVLPQQHSSTVLRIGHMDPETENAGIRTRLINLGYLAPHDFVPSWMRINRSNGAIEGELIAAVKRFQADQGMDQSGELDEATRSAIRRAHGR